jgi:Protein O-mannosyl-transferase TMEM260-like
VSGRRRDAILGAAVGLGAFLVYLRTMYPGLVAAGDTPRLQLVGRILGTAHNPGYPLYTVVSHVFSVLPVGTLAFRINLMSAVFGAIAAVLTFALARRLGCGPVPAVAAALGLAFGRVFWSQSLLAEVYTLAAALLAGFFIALVRWGETRRDGAILAAAALFALALGHHHVDVITALPAAAAYVLLTDARRALRPKMVGAAALLVALGLAQYGFVLVRTLQRAPYLASRARSLPELVTVVRGGAFAGKLFAFGAWEVVSHRIPMLARLLLDEMGPIGAALAALGLVHLARRRPREALLLAGSAAGILFFVANYAATDIAVFALPAAVALWPLAGVGLQALGEALAARWPRARQAAIPLLAAAVPGWLLVANFRPNDHSDRTLETRFFGALFRALPDRAALARENDIVDSMVLYELLGEGAGAGRDIAVIPPDAESAAIYQERGYTVFAFQGTRDRLAAVGVPFVPVRLTDGPLAAYLKRQPKGSTVLLSGSAAGIVAETAAALEAVGAGRPEGRGLRVAAIGVVGAKSGALAQVGSDAVDLEVGAGAPIGTTGRNAPGALRAESRAGGRHVLVRGREVQRTASGLALAILAPGGRLAERVTLDPADGLQVPFTTRAFRLFRATGPRQCARIGNIGWQDVTAEVASGRFLGRVDDYAPFDATLTVYVSRDRPLQPRLVETQGAGKPELKVTPFRPADRQALHRSLAADGLGADASVAADTYVSRIEVQVNDRGEDAGVVVDLGGLPQLALARAQVDRDDPGRATVCALPTGNAAPLGADMRSAEIDLGDAGAPFLGFGWSDPVRDGPALLRRTEGPEAELIIPLAAPVDTRLRIQAKPGPGTVPDADVELDITGRWTSRRNLRPGWHEYEWTVPASAWVPGANAVSLRVRTPAGPAAAGLAVRLFRIELIEGSPRS